MPLCAFHPRFVQVSRRDVFHFFHSQVVQLNPSINAVIQLANSPVSSSQNVLASAARILEGVPFLVKGWELCVFQ